MKNNSKDLDLIKPLVTILIIIVSISILGFFFNSLSQKRQEAVLSEYTAETDQYIEKNRAGLTQLFMSYDQKKLDETCTSSAQGYPNGCVNPLSMRKIIDGSISHDLKDWSSTAFLIKVSPDKLKTLTLGGDVMDAYFSDDKKKQQVTKLLNGEISSVPWDDYYYSFSGKEVIVPVKDEAGKIMGAIIRGVVE